MRLLELTCRLIAACRRGSEWGEMDREMKEEMLEGVADTPEWIDLMAFVDEVQEYRARKEDQHIRVLGQALSRSGIGSHDKCWDSLEALARKVEKSATYLVVGMNDGNLDPMACRVADGMIVNEVTLHGEDCRCVFLDLGG